MSNVASPNPQIVEMIRRAVPLKRWSGPLPSSYGLHLVWVGARSPGRLARLEEVAPRLRAEVLREWRARRLKARLAVLRARYQIKVPALPTKVKP